MIDNIDDVIESCAEKAGMTISRYLYVYRPTQPANECCMTCKHTCSGCSWGEKLEPVEGWIAEPTRVNINMGRSHRYDDDSFKIYYCPEYEADEERTSFYNDEAASRLFEGIVLSASEGYKKAMDTIQTCRIKLKNSSLSSKELDGITKKYSYALGEMVIDKFLLPKWIISKLRSEAKYIDDKELDAEMASYSPSKNLFW